MILLTVLLCLLLLLAIRVPVAFALLAVGFLGLVMFRDTSFALQSIARTAYSTPASYALLVVPLFIAMGIFAKHGNLAQDGFAIANRLLRRLPGGLAMATVLTCAAFGAVSGSSVATVASIGPTAIREMRRYGYSVDFAAGVVGSAGTLGVLIPPSIVLVLYAIVSGESIGKMLLAGIIPGLLSALIYIVAIYLRVRLNPHLMARLAKTLDGGDDPAPTATHPGESDARPVIGPIRAIATLTRVAIIFSVVMGGIYFGVATVTEAAALGAVASLTFFFYDVIEAKKSVWQTFRDAILETVSLTSMTFALLIGGAVLSFLLVVTMLPQDITAWVVELQLPPALIVIMILLLFIPMGMFLDPISMLLIGVPLTYPVVTGLGYDGIWYGILVVKLIEVGLVTPPFGLNAFIVAGSSKDVPVEKAFRGILWFVPFDLLTVALFFIFPDIVLWLPNTLDF